MSSGTQREGYPPGVPCWIDTGQPDPDAAARFYGGLFGWEFEDRRPPGAHDPYLVAQLRGLDAAAIGAAPATPAWNTYVAVESADETAAKVRDAGGAVLTEPCDFGEAGRVCAVSDPSSAAFRLWQPRAHRGARTVNAPGAWNWSDLHTRDPEAAATFYGAVFGWQADPVDLGGGNSAMWRLPGYGDFLEVGDPRLRRGQAEAGTPEGFEDAIGWLLPLEGEDVTPCWHVTFAVDDTDATADRAGQLGGTLVVPPYDAGPVRAAILRDPQGAAFSISRYDPR
jgi:predicted enzyme related to lactoylglutathione lyase